MASTPSSIVGEVTPDAYKKLFEKAYDDGTAVRTLWLQRCYTVTLLLHCCKSVVNLFLYCCYTVVTLFEKACDVTEAVPCNLIQTQKNAFLTRHLDTLCVR
jgi:hypothetical protein